MSEHKLGHGFYRLFVWLGNIVAPFFLLALRLYWGFLFAAAGLTKFGNIEAVSGFFGHLGIPLPLFSALLVGALETIGGLFLAFGFLSRLAALWLIVIMLVALGTAEYQNLAQIFSQPEEFLKSPPVTYLVAALTVFSFGPGLFSIDRLIGRKCCHQDE